MSVAGDGSIGDDTRKFYDDLAESYHLIFEDWDRSITRQGQSLESILLPLISPHALVIDAATGIGTQTIALALRGFHVIGSDLSVRAVSRARRESRTRQLEISFAAADFRALPFRSGSADAVIACDNALPHLASLEQIETAILELQRCVRPGGVVLISMRDCVAQPPGTVELRPYGERVWNGRRFLAEQEWLWLDQSYRLTLRIRPIDADDAEHGLKLHTTYLAVPVIDVMRIMTVVGLKGVTRLDEPFYQPVLLGTVPGRA